MEEVFSIEIEVAAPILIGQDNIIGRRQLIPIISGELKGENIRGVANCLLDMESSLMMEKQFI